MTEKEWLALDEQPKNIWVNKRIFPSKPHTWYMNWQGFGMIIEKAKGKASTFWRSQHSEHWTVRFYGEDGSGWFEAKANTPWEAAALAYGKMKGLIK